MVRYVILVCDEVFEFNRLCEYMNDLVTTDKLVVLVDVKNHSQEILDIISKFGLTFFTHDLNMDFSTHRNFIRDMYSDVWLFYIDADELPSVALIADMDAIVDELDNMDTYIVGIPRINTVDDITDEYIQKWGWSISDVPSGHSLFKNVINFPDIQFRLHKCTPNIRWSGRVHERIVGSEFCTILSYEEGYYLFHPKTLEKQIKQNNLYDNISNFSLQ